MKIKKIQNKNTFRFFNYKWKKYQIGQKIQIRNINWYLTRYGYKNKKNFAKFLKNKKIYWRQAVVLLEIQVICNT